MMKRDIFLALQQRFSATLEQIRQSAHDVHASVNQTYADIYPYGYHLDMVVQAVRDYGHLVCVSEDDVLPLFFGAYYHDSIEDARLTYNDVVKSALRFMNEEQAHVAAEIVYALTNDKGRSRAERAGEKYYRGIRETPYAPFVKLCDRFANISYSCIGSDKLNQRMRHVYQQELPHFLEAITPHSSDPRFGVPQELVDQLKACLSPQC